MSMRSPVEGTSVARSIGTMRTTMTPEGPACFSIKATRDMVAHAADLIRAEYFEMPGLSLTLPQAARLWSVDRELCKLGLDALVADGVLHVDEGRYCLAVPRRRACADRRARSVVP
jgi:hypothetical protein